MGREGFQMKINSFKGEYRFLSNFFRSPIEFDLYMFPTVEHAYQYAKLIDGDECKDKIKSIVLPGDAKRLGKMGKMKSNWDNIKIDIMTYLVMQKFERYYVLRQKLIETDNAVIIEGNTWGDTFWGVYNDVGENHLGKILMRVREILK